MFTLPIAAFYLTRQLVVSSTANPDNYAAAAAIIVTNLIVMGYCISAFMEDQEEQKEAVPAVGVFRRKKERTD